MTSRPRHCWLFACLFLALCGCYQTPQQRLHGRWFNHEMSIRFRPDGLVRFNSEQGLATGRYFLTDEPGSLNGSMTTRRLTLDVVRNGRRVQLAFDVTFLADDRLRLQDVTPRSNGRQPADSIRQFAMLRKAEDTPEAAAITDIPTGNNRR